MIHYAKSKRGNVWLNQTVSQKFSKTGDLKNADFVRKPIFRFIEIIWWSGRADLNRRPLAPHASALTRLRHAPTLPISLSWCSLTTGKNCLLSSKAESFLRFNMSL